MPKEKSLFTKEERKIIIGVGWSFINFGMFTKDKQITSKQDCMFKRLLSALSVTLGIASISCIGFLSCNSSQERVDIPVFSPTGGIYNISQNVSISCQTKGAEIRYSYNYNFYDELDNVHHSIIVDPMPDHTIASYMVYEKPFKVESTMQFSAFASKKGMVDSDKVVVIYRIYYPVATPKFQTKDGIYITPQIVNIQCNTTGATIRFTADGSEPTDSSLIWNGSITVNATTTFKAKAFLKHHPDSATASATYTITKLGNLPNN
jgi:hypothetical protein